MKKFIIGLALSTSILGLNIAEPAMGLDIKNYPKSLSDTVVQSSNSWVLKDVRLIDGTGAPAVEHQDILIMDGKISAITATGSLPKPEGLPVIEGEGQSVMPGLVMVHEHLFYNDHGAPIPNYKGEAVAFSSLYLAYGVTTMRTGGTMNITDDLAMKGLIDEGKYLGPEIHLTAPYIDGPGTFAFQLRAFDSEEKVRTMVRYWGSEGVKWLKGYMFVKPNILEAAIDEAHGLGMQVTGHLCSVTQGEAIDMGIDNLEHGFSQATDWVKEKEFGKCIGGAAQGASLKAASENEALRKPLFDKLIENNTYITSTLAVMAAGMRDFEPSPFALELMNSHARDNADKIQSMFASNADGKAKRESDVQTYMKLEKAFHDAGGMLVAGTDPTGWGGTIPGPGNHSTLFMLAEAGISPLDIIQIATENGAKMLRVDDRTGTLKVGMEADLILVDGKPDQNLFDLSNITMVVTDGVGIDGTALAQKFKGRIGR